MKTLEERLENVENILIHKFGTLDLEEIKEKDEAFFKEVNERMDRINKGLEENKQKQEENNKAWDELKERSKERNAKLKELLGE